MINRIILFQLLFCMGVYAADDRVTLRKIYHHINDKPVALELAKTALYFDKNPIITRQNKTANGRTKTTFSFAHSAISSNDVEKMVERFNSSKNSNFKAQIERGNVNDGEIVLSFDYDPKMIALEHDLFDAITTDKGVLIRVVNLKVLNRLKEKGNAVLQTASVSRRTVIIDCGHGGKDSGARGVTGLYEKDLTLAIGREVQECLQKKGIAVFMTRSSDVFVSLDERTLQANKCGHADVFVSIHGNSAPSKVAQGVETFCMTGSLFKQSRQSLVSSIVQERGDKSLLLAKTVQDNVLKGVQKHAVVDRHVKQSVSQVLLGVDMPAVLIEVGFLSHEREGALLADASYQREIAQGVCRGICSYYAQTTI